MSKAAKLNAISENLSFLLLVCVQNEVTGIHKFYRREIWFIETFYASFSYESRTRKSLNWFKLQGSEKPEVTFFFAFDRCELPLRLSKCQSMSPQTVPLRTTLTRTITLYRFTIGLGFKPFTVRHYLSSDIECPERLCPFFIVGNFNVIWNLG